jgi:hypothetical protein
MAKFFLGVTFLDMVGFEVQGGNSQLSKAPEIFLVMILHF